MGCGCKGNRQGTTPTTVATAPSLAPAMSPLTSYAFGGSLLTSNPKVGPQSNRNQAPFFNDPVTAALRAGVYPSHVVIGGRVLPTPNPGSRGTVGALIVQNSAPVPIVMVPNYYGDLPFGSQPQLVKPYPWTSKTNGAV